jgi:TonB family protein
MLPGNEHSLGIETSAVGAEVPRAPRLRVETLSYIDLGQSNGGMVIGVSETGLSFQVLHPLDRTHLLPINFKLPGMHQSLKAVGQVVWLNESGKGGGLRFVDMPEDCRGLLKGWLAERLAPHETQEAGPEPSAETADQTGMSPENRPQPDQDMSRAGFFGHSVEAPRDSSSLKTNIVVTSSVTNTSAASVSPKTAMPPSQSSSPKSAARPEAAQLPVRSSGSKKLRTWLSVWAAAGAIAALASFVLLRERTARPVASVTQTANNSLGLRLERHGTDWQVSWNRNADSVLKAIGGHLSITDGQGRKDLDLEPSELRGGSILYTPITNDVVVRLQLVGGSSESPASESVRIIGGIAAPPPVEKPPEVALAKIPDKPASDPVAASAAESRRQSPMPVPSRVPAAVPSPVPSIDPTLKRPRRPAGSAVQVSPDAGSTDFAAADLPAPLSIPAARPMGLNLASGLAPAPRPDPAAISRPSSALVPPQLIEGKDPVLPPAAKRSGISGVVTVHIIIEEDGHVGLASVTKGNPLLAKAAIDALMRWRYRPATLGGKPVESESDVHVVFKPR